MNSHVNAIQKDSPNAHPDARIPQRLGRRLHRPQLRKEQDLRRGRHPSPAVPAPGLGARSGGRMSWQERYDANPSGWLDCLDYLREKLPSEASQAAVVAVCPLMKFDKRP